MSSGESTTCPLCQTVVEGSDALQLHYLTNCSGYDKVTDEQPRSKLAPQSHHGDPGSSGDSSTSTAQPVAPALSLKSSVQFMWQPLSGISYPTVTLLASFDVGTVELHLDAEGGHYASHQVTISNGSYEGQLVIGDSFVHPVKKFTIERDGDIVVLQFDVVSEDQQGRGSMYESSQYYGGSQYGTGQMNKNPSYGSGGTVSYSNPMYDQGGGQYSRQTGGGGGHYDRYSGGSSSSYRRDHYDNKGEAFGSNPSNYYPTATVPSQSHSKPSERSNTHGTAPTSAMGGSGSQLVTGTQNQTATNTQNQLAGSQVIEPINIPITSSQFSTKRSYTGGDGSSGFNVDQFQQGGSNANEEISALRRQLEEVRKERDSLKQTSERVNAQWEGRVRRLEQQLGQQPAGDPPLEDLGQTAALEEARTTIMSLESEVTRLRRQVNEGSQTTRGTQGTARELAELKDRNTALEQQMMEYAETIKEQSKKHDLEVASLKEKCDAWQEEVERLSRFREQVQQLQEENSKLASVNEELTQQIQSVLDENDKKQEETAKKVSDYDTLMSRFVELQQTRVMLERELQPLRQERAAMLTENATFREGSQPQNYAKLKQEHEELKLYCEGLQTQLEEQSYLISAHQDSNVEMQQKLDQATDPERLHSIRERMERYKQERDTAKKQIEELRIEHEKTVEQLSAFAGNSELHLETAQHQMLELQEDVGRLTAKAADYESRMRRYREERNKLSATNKQLQEQMATLQTTLSALLAQDSTPDPSYLESMASLNFSAENEMVHSPTRDHQPSSPLPEYHPQQYTTDDDQYYTGQAGSPVGKAERSLSVEGKAVHTKKPTQSETHSTRDRSSPKKGKDQSFFDIAEVKTKGGVVSMYIQKPTGALNPKYKPRVVVKRSDDLFEAGTLMFVGSVGGKELAGIQMDLRQPKSGSGNTSGSGASLTTFSDGTYKDGKRYFKCNVGFGLYVPLSKVFIEMESATV